MNYLELSIHLSGSVWAPAMAPGQGRWLGSAPYRPGRRDHQPSQVLSMLSELCGQARVMEFPWREAGTTCVSGDVTATPGQTAHEGHHTHASENGDFTARSTLVRGTTLVRSGYHVCEVSISILSISKIK